MENNEIVKQKSNTWIIVVLVILLVAALGYIAYDKLTEKGSETKTTTEKETKKETTTKQDDEEENEVETKKESISGYYKGCTQAADEDSVCVELVLHEDETVFFLYDPYSPNAAVGSYTVNDNELVIKATHKISGLDGKTEHEETYKLKRNNNEFIYDYTSTNETYKLSKTQNESDLHAYSRLKSQE